jgi:hypothetical protein
MYPIKVEVEGGELAVKNSAGDIAIIPKKYRLEATEMIKTGCFKCLDALIASLPSLSSMAQEGGSYPAQEAYIDDLYNYNLTEQLRKSTSPEEFKQLQAAAFLRTKERQKSLGFSKHQYRMYKELPFEVNSALGLSFQVFPAPRPLVANNSAPVEPVKAAIQEVIAPIPTAPVVEPENVVLAAAQEEAEPAVVPQNTYKKQAPGLPNVEIEYVDNIPTHYVNLAGEKLPYDTNIAFPKGWQYPK